MAHAGKPVRELTFAGKPCVLTHLVHANDNNQFFAPDLGLRFFVPAIVDLIALQSAQADDDTGRIAARTLRDFYLSFSNLVSFVAAKHAGRPGALAQEFDALFKLFRATHPGYVDATLDADANTAAGPEGGFAKIFETGEAPFIVTGFDPREPGRKADDVRQAARKASIALVVDNGALTVPAPADDEFSHAGDEHIGSGGSSIGNKAQIPPGADNRLRAAYWIKNGFPAPSGRREQVFISFSSENEAQNRLRKRLCSHLEPVLEYAGLEQPYVFDKPKNGARYGVSFIDDIVERIASAPAGFVFKSADYFASPVCAELELPLLLWRNRIQGMPLYFIYAGANAFETMSVRYPAGLDGTHGEVVLGELGDDRKAHPRFPSVAHLRDEPLQVLLDEGKFGAIDARLLDAVADLVRALKLRRF